MNEEELVRIQKILTWSDIHPSDCTKINDLITRLSKENKQLQNNWNELKKFVEERIKSVQEEKAEFEEDLYNNYETNRTEIIIRRCELTQLEDVQERMQELEGNNE